MNSNKQDLFKELYSLMHPCHLTSLQHAESICKQLLVHNDIYKLSDKEKEVIESMYKTLQGVFQLHQGMWPILFIKSSL